MPDSQRRHNGGPIITQPERKLTVEPGDYSDVCPLCGIHRQNAGFLKATCGDGYLKPECFVKEIPRG